MRSKTLALAACVLALSGCLRAPGDAASETPGPRVLSQPDASSSTSTRSVAPASPSPPNVTVEPPPGPGAPAGPKVTDWGVLEFQARGQDGGWVIGYQPLEKVPARFVLDLEAEATSALGRPVGLLVFAPQLTTVDAEGIHVAPEAHPRMLIEPLGGRVRWDEEVQVSGLEQPVPGVFFAVAGIGGPWSINFRLEVGSGATVAPSFLSGGGGAVMAHAAPLTPATGSTRLELAVPGVGWTHMGVLFHDPPLCPREGQRMHEIQFPSGYAVQTPWEPNARYDLAGTFSDTAGTLNALVTYSETSLGVELGAVHIPAAATDLPPGLALGGYRRANGEPCEG